MARPTHQWESLGRKHMAIEEEALGPSNSLPIVVDPAETERFVELLRKFDINDVGSGQWMEQHRMLEKLNLQAHQNAISNSDEYVLEAFLTFNKFEFLIHDLLLIEAWKEKVYPLIVDELAPRNQMRLYFILYHEATVINLLEVFLYHKHICEHGGEKILELVDYVGRKLTRLNSNCHTLRNQEELFQNSTANSSTEEKTAAAVQLASSLASRTPLEELNHHFMEIDFRVCISAVSVARFICEHADVLPLSVISRITDTHDMIILIIPLIENPPWTRRISSTGKWQKLIDHKWSEVKPIDLLKITKLEGQPWIALYHLLAKQIFRERYFLNSFRKGQVLRVRKYMNDVLLDQLPFLADIQRYMDELSITDVPEPHSMIGGNSVFMFQQVAAMQEAIVKGKKWNEVAAYQLANIFMMTDKTDKDLIKMAELYSDGLEGVEDV
eukprot:gene14581-19582_t